MATAVLTKAEQAQVARAREHGVKIPLIAMQEWKAKKKIGALPHDLDFALLCAFLMQETSGGINEFGHDPTIFIGAGLVTKPKYHAYLHARKASGNREMQGVGGCQLTYYVFQDKADLYGGCWKPNYNVRVGLEIMASNIHGYGLFAGVAAYNGSGAAAQHYAHSVLAIRTTFEHLFSMKSGASFDGLASLEFPQASAEDLSMMGKVREDHVAALAADSLWRPH